MANYLTQQDVDNYGSELLDVSQRAALQVVAPYLQNLEQQSAQLRQQQAREQRRALDERVAALVPNYREVDRDPAWHQWLMGVDLMSGRIRQALLNEAIANGDARRVELFFRQFQQQQGQSSSSSSTRAPGRRSAMSKPFYTHAQIKQLYEQHRKGAYAGREAEWDRIEADIFAAQREGRVEYVPFLTK
jgi:hypothetical protein